MYVRVDGVTFLVRIIKALGWTSSFSTGVSKKEGDGENGHVHLEEGGSNFSFHDKYLIRSVWSL